MAGVQRRDLLRTAVAAGSVGIAGCLDTIAGEPTTWTETYGDDEVTTYFWDVLPTSDGGFLAVGSDSVEGQMQDALVVKFDEEGDDEWRETYGGTGWDWFAGVAETDDGYVLAGSRDAGDEDHAWDYRAWLVGIEVDGDVDWEETYGEFGFTYGWRMIEAVDDGYLFVARSSEEAFSGVWTPLVVKTDHDGDEEWREILDPADADSARLTDAVVDDDGYVLSGSLVEPDTGPVGYAVRLDDRGDVDWEETYDEGRLNRLTATDDGVVVAGRWMEGDSEEAWLLAIDEDGDERWSETEDLDDRSAYTDVVPIQAGGVLEGLMGGGGDGYMVTGWSQPADSDDRNGWIVRTDAEGDPDAEEEWDDGSSAPWAIDPTDDGGYVVVGYEDEDGVDTDGEMPQGKIVKLTGLEE